MKTVLKIFATSALLFAFACNDSTESRNGNNDSMRYDQGTQPATTPDSNTGTTAPADTIPSNNMNHPDSTKMSK
jgi:hypothetical protein